MKNNVYFVSGIDTNIGKSYATGYLARQWTESGINTITQKLIQTGNSDMSEDIVLHRELMGIELQAVDIEGLTAPEIFSYPCSPHLASEIDGRELNIEKIARATSILSDMYDRVLLEGAGGLFVPLSRSLLTIDYITQNNYPIVMVTSGRLGSINHTLLSLEAMEQRGLTLHSLIYNTFEESRDEVIARDTESFLRDYISVRHPDAEFISLPIHRSTL